MTELMLLGGAALAFVLFSVPVILALRGMSGWEHIVRRHPARTPMRGQVLRGMSAEIGNSRYGGALTFTLDDTYLHVSAFLVPLHPPFSVPWVDLKIRAYRTERRGVPVVELRLRRASGRRIELAGHSAQRLVDASDGRIRLVDEEPTVDDLVDEVVEETTGRRP